MDHLNEILALQGELERNAERRAEAQALLEEVTKARRGIRHDLNDAQADAVREHLKTVNLLTFHPDFSFSGAPVWDQGIYEEQKWSDASMKFHQALTELIDAKIHLLRYYANHPEDVNRNWDGVQVRLNLNRAKDHRPARERSHNDLLLR